MEKTRWRGESIAERGRPGEIEGDAEEEGKTDGGGRGKNELAARVVALTVSLLLSHVAQKESKNECKGRERRR
jgi:hypothetical protein